MIDWLTCDVKDLCAEIDIPVHSVVVSFVIPVERSDVMHWPPIQEYNLRLLTEDPDPYWVKEWESKRGFAEALQRGLHEAQV
jgi:hypothetical protein